MFAVGQRGGCGIEVLVGREVHCGIVLLLSPIHLISSRLDWPRQAL
jgi:hypothetical protein